MRHITLLFMLFVFSLALPTASAQPCASSEPTPSDFVYASSACASPTPFGQGITPVPLVDGSTSITYGTGSDQQIVTLYGSYGNAESSGAALTHYNQGVTLAQNAMKARCLDGSLPGANGCADGSTARIVFLFIGFSNFDVEICGGHADAWDYLRKHEIPTPPRNWPGKPVLHNVQTFLIPITGKLGIQPSETALRMGTTRCPCYVWSIRITQTRTHGWSSRM